MSTHIQVHCPKCQHNLRVRREYLGRVGSCKHCEHVFTIRDPDEDATDGAAPAPAEAVQTREQGQETASDAKSRELVERLRRERNHYRGELEVAAAERDRLQSELDSVHAKSVSGTLGDGGELESELEAVRLECERLRAGHKSLQKEADRLHGELATAQAELELNTLKHASVLQEREQESADARLRWESEHGSANSKWDDERQTLLDDAERRVESERTQASAAQEELASVRRELETELETLRSERQSLTDAHDLRDQERERLQAHADERVRECERLSNLQRDLESARADSEDALRAELDRATATAGSARDQLSELTEARDTLAARLADAESTHQTELREAAEAASQRITDLLNEVEEIRREKEAVEQSHHQERESLRTQLEDLSPAHDQQIDALRGEHREVLQARLNEIESLRSAHQREIDGLRREKEEELVADRQELEDLRRQIEAIQAEADAGRTRLLAEAEESRTAQSRQNSEWQRQLHAVAAHVEQLGNELNNVSERRASVASELETARKQIEDLTTDLADSQAWGNQVRDTLKQLGIYLP